MSSLDSIMPPAAPAPAPAPANGDASGGAAAAPAAPAAPQAASEVQVEGNAAEGLAAKSAPDAPATTNGAAPAVLSPVTVGGEAAGEPVALPSSSSAAAAPSDTAMADPVPSSDASAAPAPASSGIDMPEPAAFVAGAAPAASSPTGPATSPTGPATSPPVGTNGDGTPAAKRQRKSVAPFELDTSAPASPSVASLAPASAVGMTAAQLKFAQSAIKSLRSRPEAASFSEPVDAQALGIPHYHNIVKEPMDLATISLKLSFSSAALNRRPTETIRKAPAYKLDASRDVYGSAKEWEEDVRRIFNNCRLFNGPEHPITQLGDTLEKLFEGQLPKLPPSETAPTPDAKARRSSTSVPTIRRSSVDTTGRPKREVHPPPSRDLPWSDMPGAGGAGVSTGGRKASVSKRKSKAMTPRQRAHAEKVSADELKYASKVVGALLREKGAREFTWVFDSLPDKSLEFAPLYYQIIKRPIALDIIDGKLKQGDYNDLSEFEADMNLLFDNCFTFNTPGSDVFIMGERTRQLFRERMKKMPKAKEMSPEVDDDEDEDALGEDDDEDEEDRAAVLKRQIAALKAELDATEKSGKAASKGSTKALASAKASLASTGASKGGKKRAASDAVGSSPAAKKKAPAQKKAKASGSGTQAAAPAADEPKQPKTHKKKAAPKKGGGAGGEEEEVRVVSYHQKEELAAKITQLPDERLEGALRIIAEDKPQTSADDEEIELDIDDLSPRTLYRLYRYVVKPKVKKAPTGKAAADGRKRGTGGVKRKNLDEGEEAARILKLQEQLMQFDNAEAGVSALPAATTQAGAHDDHVESSSEEESESESESEYE